MPEKSLTIEQIIHMLAQAPPRIAEFTEGLRADQLRTAPKEGEWSANDVLAHMRSCADMWGGCIMRILSEDTPTLRAVNPRTWIRHTDYPELEFRPSFQAYITQRAALLASLEPLSPEGWERIARVTGAGKVLERSVFFYAQRLAIHERAHVKQFGRIATALQK